MISFSAKRTWKKSDSASVMSIDGGLLIARHRFFAREKDEHQ
jgi:hypothetical protein